MSTFSEEQFHQIEQILKKLDLLDVIAEDIKSIRQTNREFAEKYGQKSFEHCEKIQENTVEVAECQSEKKNNEHVKRNDESAMQGDDESVEKFIESRSGENEQKWIDQKATKAIKKFRRAKSSRRRRKSTSPNASVKVMTKSTCKVYLVKLQSAPSRVCMRKKKYKWDDGG
jgi:hypothetical protein